jgi:hypothetical protein
MYLRRGENEKALSFIDDINTANSENIKGNINLQKDEYELAYGHFKLAMQKKQDSANSLERLLPISWLLNQFEDGREYIENPSLKNMDSRNKRGIKIAFLIRLKKYAEAQSELDTLTLEYKNHPPIEVDVMGTYLSIMNNKNDVTYDQRLIEDSAERACRAFDGFSCWMAMKLAQWDKLGKTILRTDDIFSDKSMTLESLRLPTSVTPLKEQINIDQRDIEELDSNSISIK